MTYNITTTSGGSAYTIVNNSTNTDTDLDFIGKGTLNYGSSLNTNFLKLLENFANTTAPTKAIIGQLWYNTSTNQLNVYNGTAFTSAFTPLDRITTSTIGNLIIGGNSIVGETSNGNISIAPNGTGFLNLSRVAIVGTTVNKVLFTGANGMILTNAMEYNPTSDTLTVTNLNGTLIAGTITTQEQTQITRVGTLANLVVTGATTVGNLRTTGGQVIGYLNGPIGANTANTGAFTTISATSTATITGNATVGNLRTSGTGGQVIGYLTGAIGANVANTGAFTTISATSTATITGNASVGNIVASGVGGQVIGYHTGAIGANGANTGAFTTITTTSTIISSGNIVASSGTASTNNTTGALVVVGGMGVSGTANVGNLITTSGVFWSNGASFSSGGGITSPAGANTQVQFNDIGSLGASSAFTFNKGSGLVSLTGSISVNSNNNLTAIVNAGTNGVGNIGASGAGFNTVFAKATTAQYADLAEMYEADRKYVPGTVVEFGGAFEITIAAINSRRVAGIVSTNPAYLMNSEAKGEFMLPLALQGRVPCKVKGPITKGDMLVSAGDGYACSDNDPVTGSVIGKALEDFTGVEGIIEVVVGRC